MNKASFYVLVLSSTLAGSYVMAQTASPVAADNAKSNKLDPSNSAATADAQSNKTTDLDLTKRIRQTIVADKSLSTYAHNVKIVTVDGSVTLNGVVRSEAEKSAIEMKAIDIAGKNRVTNDLKVSPGK
jgi:hyperosmotically inducible periplasmic protein